MIFKLKLYFAPAVYRFVLTYKEADQIYRFLIDNTPEEPNQLLLF